MMFKEIKSRESFEHREARELSEWAKTFNDLKGWRENAHHINLQCYGKDAYNRDTTAGDQRRISIGEKVMNRLRSILKLRKSEFEWVLSHDMGEGLNSCHLHGLIYWFNRIISFPDAKRKVKQLNCRLNDSPALPNGLALHISEPEDGRCLSQAQFNYPFKAKPQMLARGMQRKPFTSANCDPWPSR